MASHIDPPTPSKKPTKKKNKEGRALLKKGRKLAKKHKRKPE